MIDNKYQSQMSKAINVAQLKVGLLMLLVYMLVGYQILYHIYKACSEENIPAAWLSTISLINLIMLEHTELQFSTCN